MKNARLLTDDLYYWTLYMANLRAYQSSTGEADYASVDCWAVRVQEQVLHLHTSGLLRLVVIAEA